MRWVTCQRASAVLPDRRNLWAMGISSRWVLKARRIVAEALFFHLHMALPRRRELPFGAECCPKPFCAAMSGIAMRHPVETRNGRVC